MKPTTPGEVLRQRILAEGGITQDQLAEAMRVSRYSVNQLVNNRRAVTAEMALRLSRATSTSPDLWLNLQRDVDLYEARVRLGKSLAAVRVVRRPVADDVLFEDR
jgi:addiction module HigA family antidote